MSKIICSASTTSVGCTFLDWSINYLSGQTQFLSKKHGWIDLVSDPMRDVNAHNHLKNHPIGYNDTQEYVEFLESHADYFSIYPFVLKPRIAAKNMNIDITCLNDTDMLKISQYQAKDYELIIDYLCSKKSKIIFVETSNSYPLYFLEAREKQFILKQTSESITQEEINEEKDLLFFKQSKQHWINLNLTEIWDQRERLALSTRPFSAHIPEVNIKQPVMKIDAIDLWNNGNKRIFDILDYCDMPVHKPRRKQWTTIFEKWRSIQLKTLEFQYAYKDILDAIINGRSMPIDLTFNQEVVIQHCLIYQFGLNLKTWNLTKFPNNTLDLHQILESNIHTVPQIY